MAHLNKGKKINIELKKLPKLNRVALIKYGMTYDGLIKRQQYSVRKAI
jgi:hypothetical protein